MRTFRVAPIKIWRPRVADVIQPCIFAGRVPIGTLGYFRNPTLRQVVPYPKSAHRPRDLEMIPGIAISRVFKDPAEPPNASQRAMETAPVIANLVAVTRLIDLRQRLTPS